MPQVKTKRKKNAAKSAKKATPDDVWAAIAETQKALKETQKIVGNLGNRFGDFAEATLVPDLQKKFREHNFIFGKIGENIKLDNDEQGIHTEIDAFLENGSAAMAVEVKVNLKKSDVDDHVRRMEKLRSYADLHGDTRKFFGAMAAALIDKDTRIYALQQGFYLIEPSGESVKIVPPVSAAKSW